MTRLEEIVSHLCTKHPDWKPPKVARAAGVSRVHAYNVMVRLGFQIKREPASYPIEKGVPVPPKHKYGHDHGRTTFFPWADMEVGDSFLVPERWRQPAAACSMAQTRFPGRRFISRVMPDGVRIWRVDPVIYD